MISKPFPNSYTASPYLTVNRDKMESLYTLRYRLFVPLRSINCHSCKKTCPYWFYYSDLFESFGMLGSPFIPQEVTGDVTTNKKIKIINILGI